jgi:hypothetical protein
MSGLSPVSQSAAAQPTLQLPQGMQQGAQNQAFGGIGQLGSFNQYNPQQAQNLTYFLTNNPYSGQFQGGAGQAAGMGMQGAQAIQGGAQQLQQGAGAVMNTAFDPQSALYQRYLQQLQQQSQAGYAQSGVGSSPYAAGLMDQNLQNFNTTWQAQQLQNQIAGLGAAGTAQNLASGMFQAAPSLAYGSAQMPYAASTQMATTGMQALQNLLGYGQAGAQLPQQQITDYMQLLGMQPGLSAATNQTALTQAQLQQMELNQLGAGVGAGANALGSLGKLASSGMTLF